MKNSKTRGATKVPNVKLRPAQASSSRSSKRQTSLPRVGLRDDDTTQGEVDLNAGNKPFEGIVLCATGDLDKRTLFARAQELGATRANDFTDQVTHLVADAPGSAKYRCAVERHLPILNDSWVEEAYQTWLNGGLVDLEQTITDHRLPIFSGVRLCLTGMDDLKTRGKIHTLLAKEGGVYLKSLDKTATHLLSCASGESPKLEWASNHNKSQPQLDQIHLVWEEWFWDSLRFGGRWDEREYEVTRPRPSRKTLSQAPQVAEYGTNQYDTPTSTFSHRTPLPSSLPTSALLGDDPPEYGTVNKVPHVRQLFYSSIFQQREKEKELQHSKDQDTTAGRVPTSRAPGPTKQDEKATKAQHKLKAFATPADHDPGSDTVLTRLANHRVASFGSTSQLQRRQPFQRIVSSTSSAISRDPQGSSTRDASTSRLELVSHTFVGYTFRAFGEARGPNLRDALEAHGGRWLEEEDEEADFLIIRLVSGGMYWREEGDETERAKYRTECWLERCIFEERICAAQEHVVFTPLSIDTPVPGSEKLQISLSGLDTAEVCWVKRLIRALGGSLLTTFSRRATHLICPSGRGAKFDKAREWGVDVVGTEWLIEIANTGEIIDAKEYVVPLKAERGSAGDVQDIHPDAKGKGKAKEVGNGEEMIMDITNSLSQEFEPPKPHDSSSTLTSSNLIEERLAMADTTQLRPLDLASSRTRTPHRNSSADSEFTLGKPSSLLSCPSSALPRDEMELESPLIIRPPSSPLPSVSIKAQQTSKRVSEEDVKEDKLMTLIPSSNSPSPLRISPKLASVSSPPVSGLRTAITALLGKRSTEDRDETDGPAQKRQGRASKRPRQPSRTKSDLEPRRGPSPALSLMSGSPPVSRLPHSENVETIPEEGPASLRVVYEDPGQRAEKKRLIALFEGGTTPDISKNGGEDGPDPGDSKHNAPPGVAGARPAAKRKSVRKSTRAAGS